MPGIQKTLRVFEKVGRRVADCVADEVSNVRREDRWTRGIGWSQGAVLGLAVTDERQVAGSLFGEKSGNDKIFNQKT